MPEHFSSNWKGKAYFRRCSIRRRSVSDSLSPTGMSQIPGASRSSPPRFPRRKRRWTGDTRASCSELASPPTQYVEPERQILIKVRPWFEPEPVGYFCRLRAFFGRRVLGTGFFRAIFRRAFVSKMIVDNTASRSGSSSLSGSSGIA